MKYNVISQLNIRRISARGFVLTALFTVAVQAFTLSAVSAATATIKLTASPTSLQQGANTIVTVQVTSDAPITVAQACVGYDSSKLSLINTDYTGTPLGSPMPSDPSADCAAGEIQIGRYDIMNHPTGSFTLARLTFKAMASSGSVNLTVGSKSYLFDNTTTSSSGIFSAGGSSGTSIALAPVPAADPGPAPSTPAPSNNTKTDTKKPSSSSTPAPAASTPAAITDSGRKENEVVHVASADVSVPLTRTETDNVATVQAAKSRRTLFILVGATLASIIAAIVMAKFFGVPGISRHNEAVVTGGTDTPVTPATPSQQANNTISRIPDANIPGPSAVIKPSEHHEDKG